MPALHSVRVLHLDSGREMRGGQWQVLRLIDGLRAAQVECTLLARGGSPLFTAAHERGWPVEPLGLAATLRLGRRHDVVHAHDARGHSLASVVPGRPLVVARRVAFPVKSRWKYRRAARFIAVSSFVRSVLIEGGVAADRITVVHDGVPLLEPSRGTALLSLATADPQKGESLAVESARRAGVPLQLTANLERDIASAGVFLYLTYSEGLGSAALLAMSAGVPVVASNVGGLREVVQHRENGLLVDNEPEAVAAALRELTENPELATRLGRAARRTVEEKFTTDLMVQRTLQVYRELLM